MSDSILQKDPVIAVKDLCVTFHQDKKSAEIAKKCMKTGIPVRQIVLDEHLLTEQELDQYLDLMAMTQPGHQVEYHMNFKS